MENRRENKRTGEPESREISEEYIERTRELENERTREYETEEREQENWRTREPRDQ